MHNLGLRRVDLHTAADRPRLAAILAEDNCREGFSVDGLAVFAAKLCRENKSPVTQRDSIAGALQNESPLRVRFYLGSNVDRLRPRFAIVGASGEHELTGFVRRHARPRTVPRTIAVTPGGGNPDVARDFVGQNRRIADPVEIPFRIVAHVHNHSHGLPRLSAIGAAAHADVDISRQVAASLVAIVVNGDECPRFRRRDAGDPVCVHSVVAALSQCHTDPSPGIRLVRVQFDGLVAVELNAGTYCGNRFIEPGVGIEFAC